MNYVTAGESHGEKLTVIINDVPAGIKITDADIEYELNRRGKFFGRSERQNLENNQAHITGGVLYDKTTGAPVSIEIFNACHDDGTDPETNYENINIPRPGHSDLVGMQKYGFDSCKTPAERASARETAARCAASAIAKVFLSQLGVGVYAYVKSVGSVHIEEAGTNMPSELPNQAEIEMNDMLCPDPSAAEKMKEQISRARREGDTLGGTFCVVAEGLVPGLGGYSQSSDRINAQIAAAVMSIPSVKGVEFGDGFNLADNVGSSVNDQIQIDRALGVFYRRTNHAGGIEGGITNGMPLVISAAMKPLPSVKKQMRSVDLDTLEEVGFSSANRSDVCAVPSGAIVAEGEVAIVLANAYQDKFGRDSVFDIRAALGTYQGKLKQMTR